MTRRIRVCAALTAGWLGGCAGAVPVVDFYDADADALRRFPAVEIVYAREGFVELGELKGLHCHRNAFTLNPHSTGAKSVAIDQLRLKAAALGADAISEPFCRVDPNMDLVNNCMGTVLCVSHALRQSDN